MRINLRCSVVYLHAWWRGTCCGAVEEIVVHQPLPELLQATVAVPRVALQGQALQVFHGYEGFLLEPTEPIVVQMKNFDQAEISKRLTAQPHQPTVRKVDNP